MTTNSNYSGPPMLAIDGPKIRRLREEQGLTQLYIATVVEVTTDTISRWENRRYPSIKKENGEKLAEALCVPLADILETTDRTANSTTEIKPPNIGPPPPAILNRQSNKPWAYILIILPAIITLALIAWWQAPTKHGIKQVSRYLPTHIPPGEIFPVIVSVDTETSQPLSMIVKETIGPGAEIIKASPAFTSLAKDGSTIKWVRQVTDSKIIFSYLARSSRAIEIDKKITLAGTITSGRRKGSTSIIPGPHDIIIKPFHWADLNRDNRIDDEEILAVYDQLNLIDDLDFNRDQIDAIWSGSGYRWDYQKGKYIIFP